MTQGSILPVNAFITASEDPPPPPLALTVLASLLSSSPSVSLQSAFLAGFS
jgi:hypothetical protein